MSTGEFRGLVPAHTAPMGALSAFSRAARWCGQLVRSTPLIATTLLFTVSLNSHAQGNSNLSGMSEYSIGGYYTDPQTYPPGCNSQIVYTTSTDTAAIEAQLAPQIQACIALLNSAVMQLYQASVANTPPGSCSVILSQTQLQPGVWQLQTETTAQGATLTNAVEEDDGGIVWNISGCGYPPNSSGDQEAGNYQAAVVTTWVCPAGSIAVPPAGSCTTTSVPGAYYLIAPQDTTPPDLASCDGSASEQGCSQTPEPINLANGDESWTDPDDYRSGDSRLRLSRVYNSLGSVVSALGVGWQHNFAARRLVPTSQLPNLPPQSVSNTYTDPATACSQGWNDIAPSQPNSAGVTASWNGSTCVLSTGQTLSVYSSYPLSTPGTSPYAVYPVTAYRPNGAVYTFACGNVTCTPTPGVAISLTVVNGGGWVLENEDGSTESYDPSGALLSVTYRGGYSQTLSYANGQLATVTDSFGRTLTFSYAASGRLQSVTTPDGATQYGYDSVGRLVSVTHPDGTTRQYQYGNTSYPNALTAVIDENASPYASIGYDSAGRAIQSSLAGQVWASSVNFTNPASPVITDAYGTSRTYQYTTINGRQKLTAIAGSPCNTCMGSAATTFDPAGYYNSTTDWNGNLTYHGYDDQYGLEISREEAAGTTQQRIIQTSWNTLYRVPAQITEPGRQTTFSYDPSGNILSKTIADLNTSVTRTWSYSNYTPNGQPQSMVGPRTDVSQVTQLSYYPVVAGDGKSGQLQQMTDPLGHITTFNSYDASGRLTQLTDPNGLVTTFTYNARGWLVAKQVGTELTHYSYDGVGNLLSMQLPNGSSYAYSYNAAHQLTAIQDQLGNRVVFTPDAMGNNTSVQVVNSSGTLVRVHSYVYNALNQLYQDIGAQGQTTTYSYDGNGNLTGITDPLNYSSARSYDALNRLVTATNAQGGVAQLAYNSLDQVLSATDPRGLVTSYTVDALNDALGTSSPDTGVTQQTVDSAGDIVSHLDNKGQLTSQQYDALNRITQVTRADGSMVTFSYDQGQYGVGHLTGMTDSSGSTTWAYDIQGDVIQKISAIGSTTLTTSYDYDTAGRLISMTFPSGKQTSYSWTNGQITSITLAPKSKKGQNTTLISNIVYQPFGGPATWTLGNGESTGRTFDLDGHVTADPVETTAYDADSRVTTRTLGSLSVLADTQSFSYDSLSHLTSYSGSGGPLSFSYDPSGNRTVQIKNSVQTTYAIDPASNRILSSQRQSGSGTTNETESTVAPEIVIGGGAPVIDISVNPLSIYDTQTATLTWTTYYADSCQASGSWNGTEATSGTATETPTATGTYTYTLTCTGSGGSTTSSAVLTVGAIPKGETLFNYDGNGSLLAAGELQYTYDAAGRLILALKVPPGSSSPSRSVSYLYNGLRQRVQATITSTQPVTQSMLEYDEAGHLLGKYTNAGNVSDATETVWLGDLPVAILKPANTYFVHADYLNTPRQVDDINKSAVWAWEPIAFGANAPNSDPNNTGTSFGDDLRFPGQVVDTEPGLRYNYYRDYDAELGTYVESDSTGLLGGSYSTYTYAHANPIRFVDPLGLCATNQPPDNPCAPMGSAPGPQQWAASGYGAQVEMSIPFGLIGALAQMSQFHHGGSLDAQAAGGSQAYANYVYGVYMAAAGISLAEALQYADLYGALLAQYQPNQLSDADPSYPDIPLDNVLNITAGYIDQIDGTLCTPE
jgi:RHS repeat-associated protein